MQQQWDPPVQRNRRLLPRRSRQQVGSPRAAASVCCSRAAAGSGAKQHRSGNGRTQCSSRAFAAQQQQQQCRSSSSGTSAGGQPRQQGGRYQRPGVGRRGRRLSGWGDVLSSATTVAARPRRLGCRMRQAGGALASRALCKLATAQTTGGWSTLVRRRTCVVTKASSRSTQHVRVAWSLATATSVRQLGTVLLVTPCGNVQLTNVLRAASQLQSAVGPSPHARRHGCALLS
jgi:hypothetical protein